MLSVPSLPVASPPYRAQTPGQEGCFAPGQGLLRGACMGKFVGGLVIGLIVGLVFSETLFPDGFNSWIEHQAQDIRTHVPGR